jgi:hypothetical protein
MEEDNGVEPFTIAGEAGVQNQLRTIPPYPLWLSARDSDPPVALIWRSLVYKASLHARATDNWYSAKDSNLNRSLIGRERYHYASRVLYVLDKRYPGFCRG